MKLHILIFFAGYISVNISNLNSFSRNYITLDMTLGSNSQLFPVDSDRISSLCMDSIHDAGNLVVLHFNFSSKQISFEKFGTLKNLTIIESKVIKENTVKYNESQHSNTSHSEGYNSVNTLSLYSKDGVHYSFGFSILLYDRKQSGLYTFTFHNCESPDQAMNMTVDIIERNPYSFLSVGEMPLPNMYYSLCVLTFVFATFWLVLLCRSKENVFRVHYLMLVLMYIKSVSLLFHGINYHFIDIYGEKEETFAILFYIIYLTKGILMFVTIVLIGTGWTFIKQILSENEKKIFVIIIPLQILTNVAHIIMFETEEGQATYNVWYKIFMFVDFVCCVAIMLPVFWSIRHLQQASSVDGKAAINLEKLKIFRHFYMMVVFYIYFTRIIVLMLSYTIPFRYTWLGEFLVELATILFFVLTGFKFRPASNNPYLRVSSSDDEAEVMTESGALEGVSRVKFKVKKVRNNRDLEMEEPMISQDNDEIN